MRRLLASESGKVCLSEGRPPTPFPTSQKGHTGGVEAGTNMGQWQHLWTLSRVAKGPTNTIETVHPLPH